MDCGAGGEVNNRDGLMIWEFVSDVTGDIIDLIESRPGYIDHYRGDTVGRGRGRGNRSVCVSSPDDRSNRLQTRM